jgi:acetyl-CoA carboxylase carboxyltransferase component
MHSSESGVTDHLARDDSHAIEIARACVADLGSGSWVSTPVSISQFYVDHDTKGCRASPPNRLKSHYTLHTSYTALSVQMCDKGSICGT